MFTEFIFSSTFSYTRQCILCALLFLCLHTSSAQSPTVRSFFPTIGGQSSSVQISGRNFTTAIAVSFGGTAASFFFITSDTSIVAFVDTGSSGAVAVTNPNGTGSLAGFTFVPPPVISSITPASGAYGDTVRIKGQHFINVYSVSFGDSVALSFNVLSDTIIKAVIANGESGQVTISTIGGYGTITDFTYTGPAITSFTPTKGAAGTIVQIKGVRFTGGTAVSFGEIPATAFTVNADTLITATVGSGGPGFVKVKTPKGTAAVPGFIVPLIKSFDPQSGSKYTVVTIKGLNFTGITSVRFGDSAAASFIIESDTVIKAVLGNGNSGSVAISNGVYTDAKDYFFYFPYYPVITSFSPDTAAAGAIVTIRGSRLREVDAVSFGNTPAASFTVVSDTVITAVVGNGSSGYVLVAGNNATDSLAGFVYSTVQSLKLCPPAGSTSITSNLSGTTYQWQLSLNGGASFSNISNNVNYSGVTNNTLQLNNIPSSFNGNIYRCVVNGTAGNQNKVQFVNNWTGAISNLWSNAGNWSCGVLPDANTDVTVNSGAVILNVNGNCRSILFAPGTSFTANTGFRLTVSH